MSSKLDQSLDVIAAGTKRSSKPRGRRAPRVSSGGITKNQAVAKAVSKAIKAPPAPARNAKRNAGSKIIVTQLPGDVNVAQIKDYFTQTIGQVKNVEIFDQAGGKRPTRAAHIVFADAASGALAVEKLQGVTVDSRKITIEQVNVGGLTAQEQKTLGDRIQGVKNQKPAAANKGKNAPTPAGGKENKANGTSGGRGGKGGKRGGRAARPVKKTAEELDAEMADYFVPGNATADATTNGSAPAGDDAMVDEVL